MIPVLRIGTRIEQRIDYGNRKGSPPVRVSKRVGIAELSFDYGGEAPDPQAEALAREALTQAGLPRADAQAITWARFRHEGVPKLARSGWTNCTSISARRMRYGTHRWKSAAAIGSIWI
jgi:hypothetical protein